MKVNGPMLYQQRYDSLRQEVHAAYYTHQCLRINVSVPLLMSLLLSYNSWSSGNLHLHKSCSKKRLDNNLQMCDLADNLLNGSKTCIVYELSYQSHKPAQQAVHTYNKDNVHSPHNE